MARIISVSNQKGGVSKTVTSVNLGIGLAREGKRVLLVDLDSQASLSISLGYSRPDDLDMTIVDVMAGAMEDKPVEIRDAILHHKEGVDLLPANIELSALEVSLVNVMGRETILRDCLEPIKGDYDIIIIDNMPSLGMLTINALAAADEIIIPCLAHYLSLKGLEQLLRTVAKVKRKINPGVKISGILITMANTRTNYSREIIDLLHEAYDGKLRIFNSIIPQSVRAAETSAEGKSIYIHNPAGKVATAYAALTKEVLAG